MIPYIGDISKADAAALARLAGQATRILEFGVGASTQVIAAFARPEASFITLDTSTEWIDKTRRNLRLLGITRPVDFRAYESFDFSSGEYDLIFDDGADEFRKDFALRIWPRLATGGVLAFHDTRRWQDARNVCHVLEQIHNEVLTVEFNAAHSNITLVTKRDLEPYENWQETEGRLAWQLGWGEPDAVYIQAHLRD